MRWFIALLIVANLALFFWLQHDELPDDTISALPPPDVGRLEVLSGSGAEQSAIAPSIPASTANREAVVPEVAEVSEEAAVPEAAGMPEVPEQGEVPGAPEVAEISDVTERAEVVLSAAPEPEEAPAVGSAPVPVPDESPAAPAPPAVIEAAPLAPTASTDAAVLPPSQPAPTTDHDSVDGPAPVASAEQGADRDPGGEPSTPERVIGLETQPPAEATPAVCAQVGPLTPEQADELIAALPVFIMLLSDIAEETRLVDAYYVMIPALDSRGEGLRMLEALEQAGITDTWLFPGGVYRNAISLGFFSRKSGALRWQGEVAERGFDAEIVERSKTLERRRLLLKNVDGADIALSLPLPDGVIAEPQPCP